MLCFRNFLVAKKFMDKRGGGRKEGVSPLPIKKFLSLSANTFAGESFQCFIFSGFNNIRDKRGGAGITIFRQNFCLSAENLHRGTL